MEKIVKLILFSERRMNEGWISREGWMNQTVWWVGMSKHKPRLKPRTLMLTGWAIQMHYHRVMEEPLSKNLKQKSNKLSLLIDFYQSVLLVPGLDGNLFYYYYHMHLIFLEKNNWLYWPKCNWQMWEYVKQNQVSKSHEPCFH